MGMRQPRLKAPQEWPVAYYHCVSRVVDQRRVFGSREKQMFVKLMRLYERVCQVRVITYCVMSNHFHVLVEIPQRPAAPPEEREILAHIHHCHGKTRAWMVAEEVRQFRAAGAHDAARRVLDRWLSRMWDISHFMKTLKQRFTQWFNRIHGRRGTLWEERYRSVIVEGTAESLAMVAAYIDLNPVRAGIVRDPKAYLWSGYGAAVAGVGNAVRGIETIVRLLEQKPPAGRRALARYRMTLSGVESARPTRIAPARNPSHPGHRLASSAVERIQRDRAQLSRWKMLRCRVRYFTAGAVIGARAFVDAVFKAHRKRFGPSRRDGARPMKGANFGGLCALRDLRNPAPVAAATP